MTTEPNKAASDLLAAAESIALLVTEKREAYGDSFTKVGEVVSILYPEGIPTDAYQDALAIVRVLDKLVRIANSEGKADAMNESPWQDILGYALLSVTRSSSTTTRRRK
tara:strand:+ start:1408 stop:1734 length:327 start_codon:yes stop_codon:yes gene_type:complete